MLSKPISQQDYQFTFYAGKQDLLNSIDSIKILNNPKIKYAFGFSSPYTLQAFINVLNRQSLQDHTAKGFKLAYYDSQKGRFKRLKFTKNQSFTQVVRIKFFSTLRLITFMKIYAERIKKMQSQYQYQLIPDKEGNLLIYMKQKIVSNMFRNQISQMKKSLCCLEVRNQVYCQKVIYSKRLDNILQKDQIKVELWYKQQLPCIVFYTFNMKQQKLKKIILSYLQFHITILKFIDCKATYLANCILFKLLQDKIADTVQKVKCQFDMEVQFNQEKCAIIIHDIDLVFQKQIKNSIFNSYQSLIFLCICGNKMRNLSNFIKRKPQQFAQISSYFSKDTLYLCFDKNTINSTILKKIFYKMSEYLDLQSLITFSWFHLGQLQHERIRQQIVQNVSNSVQNSPFIIQNFKSFVSDKDRRAILKLKHFDASNKNSQTDQIANVMFDSIYKNYKSPFKIIESSSSQQNSMDSIEASSLQHEVQGNQKNNQISESSSSSQCYKNPFQHMKPQINDINSEQLWQIQNRDRTIEDQFYQFYLKHAKIWKLNLNSKYYARQQPIGKKRFIKKASLDQKSRVKQEDEVSIASCSQQQLLVGIYENKSKLFVPTYLLKLISNVPINLE